MMDALEKEKYLRSRPSRAWQSEQLARINGEALKLPGESGAPSQSALPARIESASRNGGTQEAGSSGTNMPDSSTGFASAASRLNARTRKPLTMPSERLKRRRRVLTPSTMVFEGSCKVSIRVENPPPIPP